MIAETKVSQVFGRNQDIKGRKNTTWYENGILLDNMPGTSVTWVGSEYFYVSTHTLRSLNSRHIQDGKEKLDACD